MNNSETAMQQFRISKKMLCLILLHIGGAAVLLSAQSDDAFYILSPIVISILILGWFFKVLQKKDSEFPIVDIGLFCVIFTTLYIIIPLLGFYFGGLSFGPLSDGRLQSQNLSAAELGLFFVNHIVYLASLASAYLVFRKSNAKLPKCKIIPPSPSLVKKIIACYLIGMLYFLILQLAFGIGFVSGYGDETHILTGPLWLQQINGKLAGIHHLFYLSVLGLLILKKNDWRFRYFVVAIIAWEIISAFMQPGSRGEFVTLVLMSTLFWHKFHAINIRLLITLVSIAFLFFMFIGIFRSFADFSDMIYFIDQFSIIASATNEFQAMLGTALDVKSIIKNTNIPSILFLNDFMVMLPPQQLLPFAKLSGADWYLIQIGQDGVGVGFMWSVISQSLIGFGLGELVLRGVILGWFLSLIHGWYQRRFDKFLPSVIYTFLCLNTVLTFRDTTGAILWEIWWAVIPFTIILRILGIRSTFLGIKLNSFNLLRYAPAAPPKC